MFEYDLFLSYREADAENAQRILEEARKHDVRVFMAQEVIEPGEEWELKIREALLASRELAFVATKESLKRPWVVTECAARRLLKRVVTAIMLIAIAMISPPTL
jgi:hypothetical protein